MFFSKDIFHIKKEYGKYWLKVFYHNSKEGQWFAESEIQEMYSHNKFSILGLVRDLKFFDYYEFLLEYPTVEGYNNWRQKIFPLDASQNTNDSIQYNDDSMHISWSLHWGGLSNSSSSIETILDGCQDGNYWFSIGAKKPYQDTSNKFPGPATESERYEVQEVYLWIRIPFISFTCKNFIIPSYLYHLVIILL